MGQICSGFKFNKQQKANRRRRLKEELNAANTCIAHLQEQQQILHETLQKHYVYYPELPFESAHIHQRTAAFESEVEALERKLFLEEIAVDIADERCDFLDKNLSLLQQNEVNLQWQCSSDQNNLEALRLKHEAAQFHLYQKANPIEKWTVKSLPNIHIYFSSM